LFAALIFGNFEKVTDSERSMCPGEAAADAQSKDPLHRLTAVGPKGIFHHYPGLHCNSYGTPNG
jgi:hypothetical protein